MPRRQKRFRPAYGSSWTRSKTAGSAGCLKPRHRPDLTIFGHPLRVDTDHQSVFEAVELVATAYSLHALQSSARGLLEHAEHLESCEPERRVTPGVQLSASAKEPEYEAMRRRYDEAVGRQRSRPRKTH